MQPCFVFTRPWSVSLLNRGISDNESAKLGPGGAATFDAAVHFCRRKLTAPNVDTALYFWRRSQVLQQQRAMQVTNPRFSGGS